jgi:hypothetical protein
MQCFGAGESLKIQQRLALIRPLCKKHRRRKNDRRRQRVMKTSKPPRCILRIHRARATSDAIARELKATRCWLRAEQPPQAVKLNLCRCDGNATSRLAAAADGGAVDRGKFSPPADMRQSGGAPRRMPLPD